MTIPAAIQAARAYIILAVELVLIVLIAGTIAPKFGIRVAFIPQMDPVQLAYLAGAVWLAKR